VWLPRGTEGQLAPSLDATDPDGMPSLSRKVRTMPKRVAMAMRGSS
jgi:hypothetical protein